MLNETNIKINGGGTCAVLRLITIRGPLSYGYIQSETLLNHHNVIIIYCHILSQFLWQKTERRLSLSRKELETRRGDILTGNHCLQFSFMCVPRLVRRLTKGFMGRFISENIFDVVKHLFTFHYLLGSRAVAVSAIQNFNNLSWGSQKSNFLL